MLKRCPPPPRRPHTSKQQKKFSKIVFEEKRIPERKKNPWSGIILFCFLESKKKEFEENSVWRKIITLRKLSLAAVLIFFFLESETKSLNEKESLEKMIPARSRSHMKWGYMIWFPLDPKKTSWRTQILQNMIPQDDPMWDCVPETVLPCVLSGLEDGEALERVIPR